MFTINELTEQEARLLKDEIIHLDDKLDDKINKVITATGCNFVEALEYVVTNSPVLWAKVYLNWEARDYQIPILQEGKKSKQLVLRLGRRLGKCLPGNIKIPDSQTGDYVTVEELFKRQSANIFSMNETNLKIVNHKTDIIFENGIKPVFKITTKSGREIEATGNHPFYTIDGFKELDDLKTGDFVAIAKNMKHSNPTKIDEEKIKFIAYMLGDGNCKGNKLRFSCAKNNLKVLCEMDIIAKYFDCNLIQYDSDKECDYHIVSNYSENHRIINKAKKYLEDIGMYGHGANDKTIPNDIFKLNNKDLSIFLSRLYATDGWATATFNNRIRLEIGYCSISKDLCTGIQSLLLRFGINSRLYTKKVKYNGGINIAYQLIICNSSDIIKFCENIGIYSKEASANKLYSAAIKQKNIDHKIPIGVNDYIERSLHLKGINKNKIRNDIGYRFDKKYKSLTSEKVKKAINYIGDESLNKYIDNDIYWDEIKSIEYIGDMMTYDLTVPEYHNFVANDFITHNTDSMAILILWYAYTQINKGENGQYNILILTPYETQIDLIFTRLSQLVEGSELLKSMISRDIYHRKELKNGTIILGLTAGASSGNSGSNNTRGQRADLIILDEVDYIGSSQITNIMNIRNEAPERIRMLVASTPCGKHEEFYKWCTESSKSYKPDPKDIDNFEFNGYIITNSIDTRKEKGNGWTEIYAPSIVNKELLKINPVTEQTYLQDIKDELTELRYDQEVMAEFGDEELGVYQKKYINQAIQNGIDCDHKYVNKMNSEEYNDFIQNRGNNIRLLGVDWDKVQAGTTMVGLELDRYFKNPDGIMEPKFKVIFRIEIPKTQFTYVNAINKIVELNDLYDFDWIAIDRGYGETQLELLHKYGLENPETGLADKVVGYQFGEKINVRDPYTHKLDKKPLKPFMVNNSVNIFEKNKIVFDPADKKLIEQFEGYRIKAISSTGVPTYTDENEHAVDAVNLCLLIFQQKYGELFKNIITSKILAINEIVRHGENVDSRDMNLKQIKNPKTESLVLSFGTNNVDRGFVANNRAASIGRGAYSNFNSTDSRFSRGRF